MGNESIEANTPNAPLRKPAWLRRPLASDRRFFTTSALLNEQGLSTVCKEANCPNRQECFSSGTATFLILGETCTRNCRFCNIHPGQPGAPDPTEPQRVPFVTRQLQPHAGPVVASTDYIKNYAEQIRAYVPVGRSYSVLGADGFGRSDFRSRLREHFEINRHYIVLAALKALADEGKLPAKKVAEAVRKYAIRTDKINPLHA